MTNLRQAAQQALEALECPGRAKTDDEQAAITSLRAALAEPQTTHWEGCEAVHPECRKPAPVAWVEPKWLDPDTRGWPSDSFESVPIEGWLPLYTAPAPQPEQIGNARCPRCWEPITTPRKPDEYQLERKSDAIQRLWKERDELRALNAELVEALRDGLSVCASVSVSLDRRIVRDGVKLYAQTEEWCRWASEEVEPKLRAALAKAGDSNE